jgi:hypothetical protein
MLVGQFGAWLEDRDNVLCANEEWMHAMLYTTDVEFVRPTLGFLPASFSLSISETLLRVENADHRSSGNTLLCKQGMQPGVYKLPEPAEPVFQH